MLHCLFLGSQVTTMAIRTLQVRIMMKEPVRKSAFATRPTQIAYKRDKPPFLLRLLIFAVRGLSARQSRPATFDGLRSL